MVYVYVEVFLPPWYDRPWVSNCNCHLPNHWLEHANSCRDVHDDTLTISRMIYYIKTTLCTDFMYHMTHICHIFFHFQPPSLNPEVSADDNFGKGVVFYMRKNRVVGVLCWNVFNKIGIARKVSKRKSQWFFVTTITNSDRSYGTQNFRVIGCVLYVK